MESRRASKGEEIYTRQLEAVREETWLRDMVRREAELVIFFLSKLFNFNEI